MTEPTVAFKKKRFSKISLLRILPAAFIGLLPFNILEDYFLEQHYRLRGPVAPKIDVQAVLIDPLEFDNPKLFEEQLEQISNPSKNHCTSFLTRPFNHILRRAGWNCLTVDVANRYSFEDFDTLPTQLSQNFNGNLQRSGTPLLFGTLNVFRTANLAELAKVSAPHLDHQMVVFMPSEPRPRIQIKTPIGSLERHEVALNIATAVWQNAFLNRFDRSGQYVFSTLCALIVALVLYTYPVFFTLVFALIFAASLWVASLFVFEKWGWQLPVAASLMTLITMYFLGMSDRLDNRERREWLLDQESDNLRRLDEMRNNFLSLVSHDLKSPIARIRLNLERVLRGDFGLLRNEQSENLKRVQSASGELQRSISTLLLLSRIESRALRLHRSPNDLVEILNEALLAHETEICERDIRLEVDFEPLFLIEIDRVLILEVVNNLLDNALKYSSRGSNLVVRCGELENCPELSPPQPGAWFEVQDEGPGILVQERSLIFKKFYQGSQRTAPRDADEGIKGTGLGLYLSAYFVGEHGGNIQFFSKMAGEESRPGDPAADYFVGKELGFGTVFRVTLPVDPPAESPDDEYSRR